MALEQIFKIKIGAREVEITPKQLKSGNFTATLATLTQNEVIVTTPSGDVSVEDVGGLQEALNNKLNTSGKAASATTADKTKASLSFTGNSTVSFNGSTKQTVHIPKITVSPNSDGTVNIVIS